MVYYDKEKDMNVFDFDKTIYLKDSSTDFVMFLMKKHPSLLRYVPRIGLSFLLYGLKIIDKTSMKQRFFSIFRGVKDMESMVDEFWELKSDGIKKWYRSIRKDDDVVISASPEFLVRPACEALGIRSVIGSLVDSRTGRYTGINCHGKEKVRRFLEEYPDGHIDDFYSDSYSDRPLAEMADRAFIVKGEELSPWVF